MRLSVNLIVIALLVWMFIYTFSFARWTWRDKNKFGAVMVVLLGLGALILPIYIMYIRPT